MKNNIFFIIILFIFFTLLCLFIYCARGKTSFRWYSGPELAQIDGGQWNKLGEIDKFMYLAGYYRPQDAFFGIGNIYKQRAEQEQQSDNAVLKDLERGIDQFYNDPANRKIPVTEAMDFVLRRIRGLGQP